MPVYHTAADGIAEEEFYWLTTLGREEYSVLSVLEDVAHHDREHGQQLQRIVATTSCGRCNGTS